MEIQNVEVGRLGLIQQLADGTITQIGLTPEQSQMLQIMVGSIANGKPLVRLPKEYNLKLSGDLRNGN
jgi:hypothetical protein